MYKQHFAMQVFLNVNISLKFNVFYYFQILHDFVELGFRPAYIIYEDLHERSMEHPDATREYLEQNGYRYLTRRGWNMIFEFKGKIRRNL